MMNEIATLGEQYSLMMSEIAAQGELAALIMEDVAHIIGDNASEWHSKR